MIAFEILRKRGKVVTVRARFPETRRLIGVDPLNFEPLIARAFGLVDGELQTKRATTWPCEACGSPCGAWIGGDVVLAPGAGYVDDVEIHVPGGIICYRGSKGPDGKRRGCESMARPMLACSDECERSILAALGRSPAAAGLRP